MLSGTSPTDDLAVLSLGGEGGFISLNASSWQLVNASDAVVGQFAFDIAGTAVTRADQSIVTGNQSSTAWMNFFGIDQLDADATILPTSNGVGGSLTLSDTNPSDSNPPIAETSEIAIRVPTRLPTTIYDPTSTYQGVVAGPAYELDLSDPTFNKSLDSKPLPDNGDTLSSFDPIDGASNEPPGLSGKTAQMKIIDDPILVLIENSGTRSRDEGGALQVFDAVVSTQRDFETQLLASVASELDRNGTLPATTTPPTRNVAVVAELARAVAFDSLDAPKVAQSGSEEITADQPLIHPQPARPNVPVPTSVLPADSSVGYATSPSRILSAIDHSEHSDGQLATKTDSPISAPTVRIENNHDAAFSKWPLLATAAVAFWAVELRQPTVDLAVQVPPRRKRNRS